MTKSPQLIGDPTVSDAAPGVKTTTEDSSSSMAYRTSFLSRAPEVEKETGKRGCEGGRKEATFGRLVDPRSQCGVACAAFAIVRPHSASVRRMVARSQLRDDVDGSLSLSPSLSLPLSLSLSLSLSLDAAE